VEKRRTPLRLHFRPTSDAELPVEPEPFVTRNAEDAPQVASAERTKARPGPLREGLTAGRAILDLRQVLPLISHEGLFLNSRTKAYTGRKQITE